MSALPLKADVLSLGIYVCFVPIADIAHAALGANSKLALIFMFSSSNPNMRQA